MTTTSSSNKLTYVSALTYAIENGNLPTEIADKLIALRAQQEKRNNGDKKPTAKQNENTVLKEKIHSLLMGCAEAKTISEIMKLDDELSTLSNQKVATLVRQMVDDGKLERLEIKRKAYFKVA